MSDYIPRDVALNGIEIIASKMDEADYNTMIQAKAVIEMIYPADTQPVVHGRWIFDCERRQGDGWIYKQRHCSACGFQTVECLNYCQKCGARMDLEDDT